MLTCDAWVSLPKLLLKAMSGSMALLQPGSALMSMTPFTPKGCADRCLGPGPTPEAMLMPECQAAARAIQLRVPVAPYF